MSVGSDLRTSPAWNMALLAWPSLFAVELTLGSATLSLMLGSRNRADSHACETGLGGAMARWWRLLAVVNVLFFLLMLVNTVADMAGVTWVDALPLIGETLRHTHAGRIWKFQLPVGLALLLVTWIPIREFLKEVLLLPICTALLLMGSLTGHAIDHGPTVVAVHLVHQVAVGLWAGSLFAFWQSSRQLGAENLASVSSAATLSKLAAFSVTTLTVTGIFLSYESLGPSLDPLLHSSYGQILLIKLAVFGLVLGVASYNRYVIMPLLDRLGARRTLIRNVCAEWVTIVIVLALAALLANTAPARMSSDAPMPMGQSSAPRTEVIL